MGMLVVDLRGPDRRALQTPVMGRWNKTTLYRLYIGPLGCADKQNVDEAEDETDVVD
jgi:hypothetical protein